jgi:hypothetical protein
MQLIMRGRQLRRCGLRTREHPRFENVDYKRPQRNRKVSFPTPAVTARTKSGQSSGVSRGATAG